MSNSSINKSFFTPFNFKMVRLEYLALFLFQIGILAAHLKTVDWVMFLIAFWWIDIIGFIPAFIYNLIKKNKGDGTPVFFYYFYNVTHNILTLMAFILIWWWIVDGFVIEMLAPTIHLCFDRITGFFYKQKSMNFNK